MGIDEEAQDVARRWLYRTLVAAALVLLIASPAAADPDATPSPDASVAAVYAKDVAACGRLAPLPDHDRWLLTPTTGTGGRGSLGLVFRDRLGETHSVAAVADADGAARVRTPAGWALSRGPAGYRVAACPAAIKAADKDLIAAAPSPKARPTPTSAKTVAAGKAPQLANTGQDIGAMVLLGLTLVAAGALLLIVRRRPKEAPAPAPVPAAVYWVTAELPIVERRDDPSS